MPAVLQIVVDSALAEIAPACRAARAACAGILPAEGLGRGRAEPRRGDEHAIRHAYGGAPGHALEVSVETGRGEVTIAVMDTGAPMPDGLLRPPGAASSASTRTTDPPCPRAAWASR